MANTSIGTAWIQVKPTTKGIATDLKKEFGNAASDVENSGSWAGLGAGIATKVGAAFAVAWGALKIGSFVIDTIKTSIESYGEYEQLSGGIESMFSNVKDGVMFSIDYVGIVKREAQKAWKTLTLSQNEYFRSFSSAYPLVKSSIDDENEAIETTNRLLTLESDLANTFGYDMSTASNAINWALKGSFNYLDNLNIGIKGTQEGFLEAAHNAGYMVDNVKELTSGQILDILEKTANQYGVLGKTADEAGTTIQGSYKSMQTAWENLLTSLGSNEIDTKQAADDFATALGDFLTLLAPVIATIFESLGPAIDTLLEKIKNKLEEWAKSEDGGVMSDIANFLLGLANVAEFLVGTFKVVGTIISWVVAFFQNMWNVVSGIIGWIVGVVKGFFDILYNIGYAIGEFFVNAFNAVKSAVENVWNFIKGIFESIGNFIGSIGKGIGDFFGGIFGHANGGIVGHANGGIVGGVGTSTSDSNIVALSKGEYVINAAAARSIGYGALDAMNSTGQVFGGGFNITINGYNQDPEELANIISRKIALRERGVLA